MNISRKDIDQNNAIVTVSVAKEDYAAKVEKSLREYRKKVNMPGFRPGHVPAGMINKMYGKALKADEINNVVSESLVKYIEDNNLNILGQPLPNETEQPTIDFDSQDTFDFMFDIGIAPEFNVELNEQITIPYYEIAITDKMVDNQVKSYTSRFGKYAQVDVVAEKDMVKGTLSEMENGAVKEGGIVVENAVLAPGYMKVDEQKALFVGKNKGETVAFNPKTAFENEVEISSLLKISKEEAAGVIADFQIEINEITRFEEAELNQELFDKVFGEGIVSTEDEFRGKIATEIEENLKADSNYKFNIDARKYFVEKFKTLSFPDAFLKRWVLASAEDMTAEKIEEEYPKMIEDLIWQITKDKIANQGEVKVDYSDVEAYGKKVVKSQFAQYGMIGIDDSIVNNYLMDMLKKEETMRNFINRAAEEKIFDLVLAKVNLDKKSISMEDFNKLIEEEAN